MKLFILDYKTLPLGFKYPETYLKYVDKYVQSDIYPWRFIGETQTEISFYLELLRKEYPDKTLIPFARLEDSANGDLACFDGDDYSGDPKIYFHVFCYQGEVPPWDKRYCLDSFSEWLLEAEEDACLDD